MNKTLAETSFDWSLMRSFLAVIEKGSLLAAARQLGVSQPTLGRHVAELERQLGHGVVRAHRPWSRRDLCGKINR